MHMLVLFGSVCALDISPCVWCITGHVYVAVYVHVCLWHICTCVSHMPVHVWHECFCIFMCVCACYVSMHMCLGLSLHMYAHVYLMFL